MKVREILTRWVFKGDTNALKRFDRGLAMAKKTAIVAAKAVAGVALAATGAAVGVAALVKSTAEADDQLGKLSQKIGVSTEDLSGLKYAAELADVGLGDLQIAFKGLADKAAGAARGEKGAIDLFKRLGISAKDAAGNVKEPVALLYEVAESLKDAPSAVERSSRAIDVFGRSGLALIPMLKDGAMGVAKLQAEARKAGLVIGKDTTDAAEEFNDSITALKALVLGTAASLTRGLVPGLTGVIKRAREWVLANQGLIRGKIAEYIDRIGRYLKDVDWIKVIDGAKTVATAMATVAKAIIAILADGNKLKVVLYALGSVALVAGLANLARAVLSIASAAGVAAGGLKTMLLAAGPLGIALAGITALAIGALNAYERLIKAKADLLLMDGKLTGLNAKGEGGPEYRPAGMRDVAQAPAWLRRATDEPTFLQRPQGQRVSRQTTISAPVVVNVAGNATPATAREVGKAAQKGAQQSLRAPLANVAR